MGLCLFSQISRIATNYHLFYYQLICWLLLFFFNSWLIVWTIKHIKSENSLFLSDQQSPSQRYLIWNDKGKQINGDVTVFLHFGLKNKIKRWKQNLKKGISGIERFVQEKSLCHLHGDRKLKPTVLKSVIEKRHK